MKTIKKYGAEHIRPQCDHRTAISRLTGDISGRYGIFVETIWNSHEHGNAEHIWITVSGRGKDYELTIVDDGKGMNSARRQRSLNMAMTAEKQSGRNYQDLGLKRLAADFSRAKVYTISMEEKKADPDGFPMWVMEYEFDRLLDILAENASETISANPLTPNWKEMELPKDSTGVKILLSGVREGRPRFTTEVLRRELPKYLPPRIAAKVSVNGQPLEQRSIVGEPYRVTIDDYPALGRIDLDLYIPKVRSARDRLMIGPFEGICEWRTFCQEISEEVLGDRVSILSDGIFGEIHIEALKGYVTPSRRDFEVNLFGSKVPSQIVDFLDTDVCGDLEKILGVVKKGAENAHDEQLLQELKKYVRALGGDETKVKRSSNVLTLDTASVEVLPNQRPPIVINVDKYNDALTIVWDTTSCGGTLDVSADGRRVKYLPGRDFGSYTLSCYYEEDPSKRATVNISIVSKKKLRVHPQSVTVRPGCKVTFHAINSDADSSGSQNLRWRLSEDDTQGRFIVDTSGGKKEQEIGYGDEAVYRAGHETNTYRVYLYDMKNTNHVREVTSRQFKDIPHIDVTVAELSSGQEEDDRDNGDVIIEGVRYDICFDYMENSPNLSRLFTSSKKRQIAINRCHPACRHVEKLRGDDGLLEQALTQMLLLHIDEQCRVKNEQLNLDGRNRRFADLYAEIAQKYEARES